MKTKEEALIKNKRLVKILSKKRKDMCSLGTKSVKFMLNKLIKEGDLVAKAYRIILEIEDLNIKTKDNLYYCDYYYWKKECFIKDLINICIEGGFVFGKQESDVKDTHYIIYFELPDCEQISFHSNLSEVKCIDIKEYEKSWDGLINSTLSKIEKTIMNRYYDELCDRINKKLKKG